MKQTKVYLILTLVLLFAVLLSLMIGSAPLSLSALWAGMMGKEGFEMERIILLSIRLPRTLAALIAGVGLSVAGVLLQSVMHNPLASPNIIGVNAGAGLGVIICLTVYPEIGIFLPFVAFAGAFLTSLLILWVARHAGYGKESVILTGVACTALFQAAISFLATLDTDVLSQYNAFSVGGFFGVSLTQLFLPGILVLVCYFCAQGIAGRLSALTLGDEVAAGLGIHVGRVRTWCLVLASMSAASVISYAGLLGFVGLVVPHMARKCVGEEQKKVLPASALLGGILVIFSDLAGRTLFAPSEISAGIVMAMIGAPFFFILLWKRRFGKNAGI